MRIIRTFRTFALVSSICLVILSFSLPIYSFTDQANTERILEENKHYIHYINVGISNFAPEKKDEFMKVYAIHFNADVAYLQSDYKRAYKRIYASQGLMKDLYKYMLHEHYWKNSKEILDKLAPRVIRSKNARARLYLTLGYRDLTVCSTHYKSGQASNPKLFSYKIFKYESGIKMARRAKKYGFLSLFECQKGPIKRKIYNQLMKTQKIAGSRFYSRYVDLDEKAIINELSKSFGRVQKDEKAAKAAKAAAGTTTAGAATAGTTVVKEPTFEKKLEKRIRFKNENKMARYILNNEFDKAEDIMRQNLADFNYKLIIATFDLLTVEEKDTKNAGKDYEEWKVHLNDNYMRLAKDSVLKLLVNEVKVEDAVTEEEIKKKKEEEKSAEDEGTSGEAKTGEEKAGEVKADEEKTTDKKD
ncbi:MAG: hypothetical protein GY754_25565 [bacterium]|nr:hypothetical protein [bacterium]